MNRYSATVVHAVVDKLMEVMSEQEEELIARRAAPGCAEAEAMKAELEEVKADAEIVRRRAEQTMDFLQGKGYVMGWEVRLMLRGKPDES